MVETIVDSASPVAVGNSLPHARSRLLGNGIWFLVTLLLTFWLIRSVLGSPENEKPPHHETRMLDVPEGPGVSSEVMGVQVATEEAGIQIFRGKLLVPAATAYEKLTLALRGNAVHRRHCQRRLITSTGY